MRIEGYILVRLQLKWLLEVKVKVKIPKRGGLADVNSCAPAALQLQLGFQGRSPDSPDLHWLAP
jgi:hypothetical protein